MISFLFIAGDDFILDDFQDVGRFVEKYPDFQSVPLNDEEELLLLLKLLEFQDPQVHDIDTGVCSKYWDLSEQKYPEFNREEFDTFYDKWLSLSKRENNFDEYGSLVFLEGMTPKWNRKRYRLVVKENA